MTAKQVLLPACALAIAAWLTGCSTPGIVEPSDDAPLNPRDVSGIPNAVPKPEPLSRYGNPQSYVVYGERYFTLPSSKGYRERGLASWYGTKFHGKRTSSGEPYDLYAMTAAHKTLPLPTYVEVTNLDNKRSVIVKVNDRGPFHDGRIIDLSYSAAHKLGILGTGTGRVEVHAIDPLDADRVPSDQPVLVETDTPSAPEANSQLFLQVGAFQSHDNAQRLRSNIEGQNLGTVRIVESATTAGTFYKVQVGPLPDTATADRIARALKPLGINEARTYVQ
ncbi:MAG: septal ring lytic transglycosylase RlpA family protein [Gammaproteobacteria bacterium]